MIYSFLMQQSFSLDKCRVWNGFSPWTLFFLRSSNPHSLLHLHSPLSWLICGCCHLGEQWDPTMCSSKAPASTQLPTTHAKTSQSAPNLLQLTQAPACLTGSLLFTVVHSVASLEPDPKTLKSTGVSPCQNLFWSLSAAQRLFFLSQKTTSWHLLF